MPLYEYECLTCHRHTEKIQKFSDPEITTCPHCGGPIKRVISAPAFALKGSGWYADGYGLHKPSSAAGGESTPSDSAPKSDATPAPAAPSTAPASTPAPAASPAATTKT